MKLIFLLSISLVTVLGSSIDGNIITSVGYVFETFSPYAMVRFFEFSDRGWNISENCLKDMYNYLEGLRRGSIWAVKLYDATSYYAGAALGSSKLRIQNPQLCRGLLREYRQMPIETTWNLGSYNGTVVPFAVQIVLAQYLLEVLQQHTFKTEKIQQLICFPMSCHNGDLSQILDVYLFQSNEVVRNNTYLKNRILTDTYSILQDFDFYILICMLLSSVLLSLIVYTFEYYVTRLQSCQDHSASNVSSKSSQASISIVLSLFRNARCSLQSTDSENKPPPTLTKKRVVQIENLPKIVSTTRKFYIQELIDALTIQSVTYGLLVADTSNDVIAIQEGFFNIFALLLIYAHVSGEIGVVSNNVEREFLSKSSTYLMDMYFFICGSRLSRQFFKTIPREKLNVFEQLMHILNLILHKIFSLIPTYTFSIFAERLVAKHFQHNIVLELPSNDARNCKENMWSNILYVDTFFPLKDRCMPWTWYISLEVQFFIIACLVLLLSQIRPKYAIIIGISLFLVSISAATFNELHPSILENYSKSLDAEIMDFNLIYDNICLRISPYLLGICLGYILNKTKSKIDLNVLMLICGWVICILLTTVLLFGQQLSWFNANNLLRATVSTLGHTMWALILFWFILVSVTQNGASLNALFDYKVTHILTKLSPITLLIAPIVIRLFVFSADLPIYANAGHTFLITIGCSLAIYACALTLYILLDGPLVAGLDVIMRR